MSDLELTVRIIGEDMGEIDFGERESGGGRARLFLAIQKGEAPVDPVPVTDGTAAFTAHFRVSPLSGGATNFLGPYAHGTRTARFCYLCWLYETESGEVTSFSRIKLHLSPLRWVKVETAARAGTPLTMRLSLLGNGGKPVVASVPEDHIHWEQ